MASKLRVIWENDVFMLHQRNAFEQKKTRALNIILGVFCLLNIISLYAVSFPLSKFVIVIDAVYIQLATNRCARCFLDISNLSFEFFLLTVELLKNSSRDKWATLNKNELKISIAYSQQIGFSLSLYLWLLIRGTLNLCAFINVSLLAKRSVHSPNM